MRNTTHFFSFCGIVMLISELWKQYTLTYLIGNGSYIWWNFPFQLCSIPMYVCLFIGFLNTRYCAGHFPLLSRQKDSITFLLQSFLMTFGLLGGIFAFFDTSGMHYSYLPLTVHSYAWHILLIILGCYSGFCQSFIASADICSNHTPSARIYTRSSKLCSNINIDSKVMKKAEYSYHGLCFSISMYLVCCFIATILNLALDKFGTINLFYINPHYLMHQKVFVHITDHFGNVWGILSYILASILGASLFYIFWFLIAKRKTMKIMKR